MSKEESFTLDLAKLTDTEKISFTDITGAETKFINPQTPTYWEKSIDQLIFNWGDESVLMALAVVLEHRQLHSGYIEKPMPTPTLFTLVNDRLWTLGEGEKIQERPRSLVEVPFNSAVNITNLKNSSQLKSMIGVLGIRYYHFQSSQSFVREVPPTESSASSI